MAYQFPKPPHNTVTDLNSPAWARWFLDVSRKLRDIAAIAWDQLDFTGSNLTDLQTRNHNDLQSIQGGTATQRYHLTVDELQALRGGRGSGMDGVDGEDSYAVIPGPRGLCGPQGIPGAMGLDGQDAECCSQPPSMHCNQAIYNTIYTKAYQDYAAQASNPPAPPAGVARFHSATTQGFTRFEQDNEATTNLVLGRDSVFIVRNTTAGTIAKGTPVCITGATGNVPNVGLAKADSISTMPAIGILLDSILTNNFGQCMNIGILATYDTSAYAAGDQLFVSSTVAGGLTKTRPVSPALVQRIGAVLVSGVGNGSIAIDIAPFMGGLESGTTSNWASQGTVTGTQLISNVAIGTPPLAVTSTTPVANLSIGGNAATVTGLSVTAGKTVTFNHTSTFTTTDGQTYTFPTTSATLARTDAANTFTGTQTFSGLIDASGASAGQVKFPATQNASSDANTLDDYEEGTFIATLATGATTTPTTTGNYTKIGRLVHVQLQASFGSITSSGAGITISGLPYACTAASQFAATGYERIAFTNTNILQWRIAGGGTTLILEENDGTFNHTAVAMQAGTYSPTFEQFTFTYRTAT